MGVKREALENGKVLQILIEQFENNRTEKNLYAVLRCLRDSFVWIPGNFIMNKEDKEKLTNEIAGLVENGEYPNDEKTLGKIVQDICYNNAEKYFDLL